MRLNEAFFQKLDGNGVLFIDECSQLDMEALMQIRTPYHIAIIPIGVPRGKTISECVLLRKDAELQRMQ